MLSLGATYDQAQSQPCLHLLARRSCMPEHAQKYLNSWKADGLRAALTFTLFYPIVRMLVGALTGMQAECRDIRFMAMPMSSWHA